MAKLSKSKLILYRQCPRRLWLHENRSDLIKPNPETQAKLDEGNKVGDIARRLYGPGTFIETLNSSEALDLTREALKSLQPIFEAAFCEDDVLIRADLLIPKNNTYRLIEVKSSTSVKAHHLDDVTIQAWVMKQAGLKPDSSSLAFINNEFNYKGNQEYDGLLAEEDLSSRVEKNLNFVPLWIKDAQQILESKEEPLHPIGEHCATPFQCDFIEHCMPHDPNVEYPVEILPYGKTKAAQLRSIGYKDLRDVPASELSNPKHLMIHAATISGKAVLSAEAPLRIKALPYPRYYIDFETISFAVPAWAETRPYMQIPFQWSCHIEKVDEDLKHLEFLDISGNDPRRVFSETLIKAVGNDGPVVVYNGAFEGARIKELALLFPDLSSQLLSIVDRFFDLLPFAREYYYHPEMKGSWSIKNVLPTIAPELSYSNLEISNGSIAQDAYRVAINKDASLEKKEMLRTAMLKYCGQDTLAMYKIIKAWGQISPNFLQG